MKTALKIFSNLFLILNIIFAIFVIFEMLISHSPENHLVFLAIAFLAAAIVFRIIAMPLSNTVHRESESEAENKNIIPEWIAVPDSQFETNDEVVWRVRWSRRNKHGDFIFAGIYSIEGALKMSEFRQFKK